MNNCYKVLGNNAYRFYSQERLRPINMVLFESLSYAFAMHLPKNLNISKFKQKVDSLKAEMAQSKMFTSTLSR